MQIELRRILRAEGMTAIFVTHDQEEALVMSDRIAVMNAGRIEQLGTPAEVYARPATPFVMDFVGLSTRLAGTVESAADGVSQVRTAFGTLAAPGAFRPGARVVVGLRPERAGIAGPTAAAGCNRITARAPEIVYLGSRRVLHFACEGDDRMLVEVGGDVAVSGGEATLEWPVADTLLFPAQGEA